MDVDEGQVRRDCVFDARVGFVSLQAPGRRAHQFVDTDPVARQRQSLLPEPGHVEQVLDVAVQALAFDMDGLQQALLVLRSHVLAVAGQTVRRPVIDASGERRSCDTEDSSADRRRPSRR